VVFAGLQLTLSARCLGCCHEEALLSGYHLRELRECARQESHLLFLYAESILKLKQGMADSGWQRGLRKHKYSQEQSPSDCNLYHAR